jgi:hypothetical protein
VVELVLASPGSSRQHTQAGIGRRTVIDRLRIDAPVAIMSED